MINKKGQEGVSIGTILIIVLGLVAVVVLIVGVSGGFGNFFEKIGAIFGSGTTVETIIQVCNGAASSESKYLYCSDFKQVEFESGNEYINCEDPRVRNNLKNVLTCDTGREVAFCDSLTNNKKGDQLEKVCDNTKVNGKSCRDWASKNC